MSKLHCACVQLRSSDVIQENIETVSSLIREAARGGAKYIVTPENTSFLDIRKGAARKLVVAQPDDLCLKALRLLADELDVWLQIGSLAVLSEDQTKFANRSFLINSDGEIVAHYDKIHMFDVEVGDGQSYRESRSYMAGNWAVLADTQFAKIGMSICYDVRFPSLYRELAQAGAQLVTLPAAFTQVTGEAHWHSLIRARAIENGVFMLAAAQGGLHADGRETYGHSMIASPWGDILAEAGEDPCVISAEIDLDEVERARSRIPSLQHGKPFVLKRFE
ncbi:carbon-nitrogen hydrolase family protein [Hirschia maritima]|uniref:carbon-nitrogen hydrolase family protein n=1 Tax=Hirschia maritima TaxID=1121961 RepID=UPI000368E68C|nr:carbon-nitrogen hydrolase family protein [Hirschia maritima]